MREKKKNIMRTPEEKESIILESYQFGGIKTAKKYDIGERLRGNHPKWGNQGYSYSP
jgi:hypothetical protein